MVQKNTNMDDLGSNLLVLVDFLVSLCYTVNWWFIFINFRLCGGNMEQDIQENRLQELDAQLLPILLQDKTTGHNLIWGTDSYVFRGDGYGEHDEIAIAAITGENGNVIIPRMKKLKADQEARSRDKGEVFTPAWVVNEQNNLVDAAWFGHKVVFNYEREKKWKATYKKICFPKALGKTWQDYVLACRMEVSCGEAPYLTSRYDAVSGDKIPVKKRVGLLDRKLRIVTESTENSEEWLHWAEKALQSIYAFDWQGDNILLARENVLYAVVEAYEDRFHEPLPQEYWIRYADIVVWNVWQMDGLRFVVPDTCHDIIESDLIGREIHHPCLGCRDKNHHKHNGLYCMIMDWEKGEQIRFVDTMGGDD